MVAHGAVPDEGVGEREDLLRHRAAFGAVAVEQRVAGPAGGDQGELPAQVVRVHDPGA